MSLGVLTLKIGLVSAVAGISIVTPIVLSRNNGGTSDTSLSQDVSHGSESTNDSENGDSRDNSRNFESERQRDLVVPEREERAFDSLRVNDSQVSQNTVISPSFSLTDSEFNKECFVVPATFSNGENAQLLTCYEDKKIKDDYDENQAEHESVFHIYDPSKGNIPLEVKEKDSLLWNPSEKQISVRLVSNSDATKEYIFKAEGQYWGGVSSKPVSLLGGECSIYEAVLKGSATNETHLLTCVDDTSAYSATDPKGIPLTSWTREEHL